MSLTTFIFVLGCLLIHGTPLHPADVIAHRGNSSESPENTLTSFRQAIEMGVDFIECDVQLTKDKIPVVIHDFILKRTTDNPEPLLISELTAAELKQFDAGSWFDHTFSGEKIPTLEEVLHLPLGQTGLLIEIKDDIADESEIANAVAKVCSLADPSSLLISSFNPFILLHMRHLFPEGKLVSIIDDEKHLLSHEICHPAIYAISEALATPDFIQKKHEENKAVWVWTIDDSESMERLLSLGVDGIITNHPKAALSLKSGFYVKPH